MKISDLKKRKEELGYTNEMVSALSGVPLGTVQKIFGGATSRPRYNTLQSIECVLFPELHSKKEAALYRDIVHNLTLDYADRVNDSVMFDEYMSESAALDEYAADMPEETHKAGYEKLIAWKEPGEYTVDDLRELPDGAVMELLNGVLYDRNTPTKRHQFIATRLTVQLSEAVEKEKDGHCLVLTAPTGVIVDPKDKKNLFIPDVFIVCDKEKYAGDDEEILGAPDFVAEIMSPSTEKYDRQRKFGKYWDAGVREYWIIDIENKSVWTYLLNDNAIVKRYSFDDQIPLEISGGKITVDFKSINERMKNFFGEKTF